MPILSKLWQTIPRIWITYMCNTPFERELQELKKVVGVFNKYFKPNCD